jgi:predicted RNA-binding Zn-ribbon protein involved in translation (DUF1610 family)
LVRIEMSQEQRTCTSCGAKIPAGARECPSCGRLAIDRRAARLGAAPEAVTPPPEIELEPAPEEKVPEPVKEAAEPAGETEKEPVEDKPDSHYSIAPKYEEPAQDETPVEEGAPKEKVPGCGGCAVFVVLLYWLVTLAMVL